MPYFTDFILIPEGTEPSLDLIDAMAGTAMPRCAQVDPKTYTVTFDTMRYVEDSLYKKRVNDKIVEMMDKEKRIDHGIADGGIIVHGLNHAQGMEAYNKERGIDESSHLFFVNMLEDEVIQDIEIRVAAGPGVEVYAEDDGWDDDRNMGITRLQWRFDPNFDPRDYD
jgi:hypothetical protein